MKLFVTYTAALLLACVLCPDVASGSCSSNFVDLGGKCYHFFDNIQDEYLEAREICQQFPNGDLAVIEDCNDLGLISAYISLAGIEVMEGYWVGGSDVLDEGNFVWIDGSSVPRGAPFWGRAPDSPLEPSGGAEENCAFMATGDGFYFQDGVCQEPSGMAPLCQIDNLGGVCPAPYVAIGTGCYEFLTVLQETWADARYICQSAGGDLAIVDDCQDLTSIIQYINSAVSPLPATGFWIGATDNTTEGEWVWQDGSMVPMGTPFWGRDGEGPLQPDDQFASQNCLELWARDRYYFNDVECEATGGRSPLCEVPPE